MTKCLVCKKWQIHKLYKFIFKCHVQIQFLMYLWINDIFQQSWSFVIYDTIWKENVVKDFKYSANNIALVNSDTYKLRFGHVTVIASCQLLTEREKLCFILFCSMKFSSSWISSILSDDKNKIAKKMLILKPILGSISFFKYQCKKNKFLW